MSNSNSTFHADLATCLSDLEAALRSADMWSSVQPSANALSSSAPFCIDTLLFEEWCQWVFIPQITYLLNNTDFKGLTNTSNTATMAEFAFSQRNLHGRAIEHIIRVITRLDYCLNHQLPTKH